MPDSHDAERYRQDTIDAYILKVSQLTGVPEETIRAKAGLDQEVLEIIYEVTSALIEPIFSGQRDEYRLKKADQALLAALTRVVS